MNLKISNVDPLTFSVLSWPLLKSHLANDPDEETFSEVSMSE